MFCPQLSSCNYQVSRFKPCSRSGLLVAISKFQDSHQDPGQGFKLQFPSFKIQTKIHVRVSSCNFQVSRSTPRSRSGFQVAIAKFQDSNQVPGQGFTLHFPRIKIQTKIQVRVSSCNLQVSRFTPFSKGEFRIPLTHVEFWAGLIPWHTGSSWLGTSPTDPSVFSQNCDRFADCCSVACRLCIERLSLAASLLHGCARW